MTYITIASEFTNAGYHRLRYLDRLFSYCCFPDEDALSLTSRNIALATPLDSALGTHPQSHPTSNLYPSPSTRLVLRLPSSSVNQVRLL
jgi:hypothetical protein